MTSELIIISQYDQLLTHSYITRGQSFYHIGNDQSPVINALRVVDENLRDFIVEKTMMRILNDQDTRLTLEDLLPEEYHLLLENLSTKDNLAIVEGILDGAGLLLDQYYQNVTPASIRLENYSNII